MATTLILDQTHPLDLLALYVQVDGVLTNAHSATFAIFDDSDGAPGVQVIPALPDTYVDVGDSIANFATGCYACIDPETSEGWAPGETMRRGRVVWRYQLAATDPDTGTDYYSDHVVEIPFEVVATTVASRPGMGLALVQDVRDFGGIAASTTDAQILAQLRSAQETFERLCRQRFRPVREARRMKGDDSDTLFLPEPMFGLTSITADGSALDLTVIRVYGSDGDDRRNPKLEIANEARTIFTPSMLGMFRAGSTPYLVSGVWGFIEPDTLRCPSLLKDAAVRWARLVLAERGSAGPQPLPGRKIRSEMTDRHSITYADAAGTGGRVGLEAILRDPVIADVLSLYRASPLVAVVG